MGQVHVRMHGRAIACCTERASSGNDDRPTHRHFPAALVGVADHGAGAALLQQLLLDAELLLLVELLLALLPALAAEAEERLHAERGGAAGAAGGGPVRLRGAPGRGVSAPVGCSAALRPVRQSTA